MNIFKHGGSYSLKTVKIEVLEEAIESVKDFVVFENKEGKKVTFLVGRKVVVNNTYLEVEYKLTRDLVDKYKNCTDGEIAKIIAENPNDVTDGFYGYVASMIVTLGQTLCNLPALFTSTEYVGE